MDFSFNLLYLHGVLFSKSADFQVENAESYVDSVKNAGILIQIEVWK